MRKKMKSIWMSSRKSNNKLKSKNKTTMKMTNMPMMTNSRRAQDQRSVLKVVFQVAVLAKKLKMAKNKTCLMIWRTMMMTSMKMK